MKYRILFRIKDLFDPSKHLIKVAPTVKLKYLEKNFRSKVLVLLLAIGVFLRKNIQTTERRPR